MAITATHLAGATDSDGGSTSVTASIAPGANRLILVAVAVYKGGDGSSPANPPAISSVIGNGITYDLIASANSVNDGFGPYRMHLYRGMSASPSAGAITITLAAITDQIDHAVTEIAGVDTTGTNGAGAVVQSTTATVITGTSITATLAAFGHANNGAFGCAVSYNGRARTPGSGWTELSEVTQVQTQWRATNDTTCDWTWTSNDRAGAVAVEIKAGAAVAAGNRRRRVLMGAAA